MVNILAGILKKESLKESEEDELQIRKACLKTHQVEGCYGGLNWKLTLIFRERDGSIQGV